MKRFAWFGVLVAVIGWLVSALAQTGVGNQTVAFQNGAVMLEGTLSLPSGRGPFPALILLSGSGPQDRDEAIPSVPNYAPFRWIAESLAADGYAVLRFDDRGTGRSTGQFQTATSADFASDAEAALGFMLERPEIDARRVGFLGHSEGGMLAAMVAARNPKVAFVISMAGPGVRGYELMIRQNERILKAMGVTGAAFDQQMGNARRALDLILARDWAGLESLMYPVALEQLRAQPGNAQKTAAQLEAEARTLTQKGVEDTKGWLAFFVRYPIEEDWARVQVPVLALFGTLDTQVDAAQNRAGLEAALARAGNRDVTVRVFETANHLFQDATTGSPTEYQTLPMRFVPGFLETIRDWLRAHVGAKP